MSPPSLSPSGDPEKSACSSFLPPPIQRLSRSLSAFNGHHSHSSDRLSILPLQSSSSPLPGPNRAPSILDNQPTSSSRPSDIFPRLHRLEIADDTSSPKKPPLLELKLSSPSFLDAVAADSSSGKSLYAVETVGASTTIWRSDPWDGSAKIADVRWPKEIPLKGKGRDHETPMVQMDDRRWRETTSLLRHSNLGSSRKFSIPHHPHPLRWKRDRNLYACTTPGCKGPVAILDSFDSADAYPRLRVFETLATFHQSVPQLDHAGISLHLLDHLFVTALLLVTEPEDWMILSRNPTSLDGLPSHLPVTFRTASNSRASNRQWRKIMYGEPMYPSLKTPSFDKSADNAAEDADVLDISEPPQSSASRRQWRKIFYGEPLYPSLRSQSVDGLDLPPRPSTATSFSSESAYSPHTPSSAPSTRFYDPPSPFDDTERPHRGGDDARRMSSPLALSSGTLSPLPSSECIRLSPLRISTPPCAPRELPSPPSSYQPPPSFQPWLHRSRSSPKLGHGTQSPASPADDQDDQTHQSRHVRIATAGMNVRQLPTPPQRDTPSTQTQHRQTEARRLSQTQTHQRSLPPTPGSISRSSSTQPPRHIHSLSQEAAMPSPPAATPSTPQPGSSVVAPSDGAAGRRARHEKDPNEVIDWMRSISRAHRRRVLDDDQVSGTYDPGYEAPPAYNAIDFSTPPQARSPPEGAQS